MCLISKESDGISFKSNKKEGQKIASCRDYLPFVTNHNPIALSACNTEKSAISSGNDIC